MDCRCPGDVPALHQTSWLKSEILGLFCYHSTASPNLTSKPAVFVTKFELLQPLGCRAVVKIVDFGVKQS